MNLLCCKINTLLLQVDSGYTFIIFYHTLLSYLSSIRFRSEFIVILSTIKIVHCISRSFFLQCKQLTHHPPTSLLTYLSKQMISPFLCSASFLKVQFLLRFIPYCYYLHSTYMAWNSKNSVWDHKKWQICWKKGCLWQTYNRLCFQRKLTKEDTTWSYWRV